MSEVTDTASVNRRQSSKVREPFGDTNKVAVICGRVLREQSFRRDRAVLPTPVEPFRAVASRVQAGLPAWTAPALRPAGQTHRRSRRQDREPDHVPLRAAWRTAPRSAAPRVRRTPTTERRSARAQEVARPLGCAFARRRHRGHLPPEPQPHRAANTAPPESHMRRSPPRGADHAASPRRR